ncbi:AraC family transcriptional regulator [Hymenobacter cellulosivorans]|uniref:Helix-turn-helix domain-containing protein n=1 Tax=Hymenobacter cellulosivorans TaxID=2932249 RepID=A0ABY4FHN9_9BACT|nr:helix-turn-helix domain-containing protein [Hymenobacter cellulosivorans]UOQ55636.1 helix-turn-helix domain-containing protein [Hymenobacter cellulosivorans]
MDFQQFAPPESLQGVVRYFWTLQQPESGPKTFRTIADGCPGLILQHPGGGAILDQTAKPWPELLLYGQATQATTMVAEGPFQLVGACLQPGAERLVFNLRADELTDTCLDASLLPGPGRCFARQLLHTESLPAQLDLLTTLLLAARRATQVRPEPGVQHALTQILRSQGRVSLPTLLAELPFSERSFQRKFQEYVGVSPKLFARICRFQTSLGQLRAAQYEKLSDLASANDYADQSHHIRAFREFAGVSPHQYGKRTREVLENLTELL